VLIVNELTENAAHEDPGHPERPERVGAVAAGISSLHLGGDVVNVGPYRATRTELARVHDGTYLDELGAYCYAGGGDLDEDTYATYDSWAIAQFAAGAGLAVVDELTRRGDGVGFVAVRPPGHHALRDRAMGFCLLNNVAVSAAALADRGERVLILDWDVHHGNGTQSMFWNDPRVLYVSTHQWPLFPGTGVAQEVGGVDAVDRTLNIPVPPGSTGDTLVRALDEVAAPVIDEFDPTWVLVSAGYDAHRADPMSDLLLTSGDFAMLARRVREVVPAPGRLALFLEGGYNLEALRTSVAATLGALLDAPFDAAAPSAGGAGGDVAARVREQRRVALEQARAARTRE
jgi:acetoin utilization deacetylase AcuC-like enzyme